MAKTKNKVVNPVDAEFTEIMDKNSDQSMVRVQSDETPESESTFNKAVKQITEENAQQVNSPESNEQLENEPQFVSNRFIFSECLYIVSGDERPDQFSDISEFLIDLDTILALEKLFPERLKDFGISEAESENLELNDSCIVHSSAFPEAIVVMDYTFDEMVTLLVSYREIKK